MDIVRREGANRRRAGALRADWTKRGTVWILPFVAKLHNGKSIGAGRAAAGCGGAASGGLLAPRASAGGPRVRTARPRRVPARPPGPATKCLSRHAVRSLRAAGPGRAAGNGRDPPHPPPAVGTAGTRRRRAHAMGWLGRCRRREVEELLVWAREGTARFGTVSAPAP